MRQSRDAMESNDHRPKTEAWRTPAAIGIAVAIGIPVGVFFHASAVPFGPVLLGWLVALVGAVVVVGALSLLATRRYVFVGFGYAAGVAAAAVISRLVFPRSDLNWWGPPLSFAVIFAIVSVVSLICSGLCALVKWKDQRAREREKQAKP
jgi:uncharacterized membrane protein HdeD (DUF308 family)